MQVADEAVAVPPSVSDRRSEDRRARATPIVSRYTLFGGRRVGDRRSAESSEQYVDRYPAQLAVALVTIGVLCVLDAAFTLLYLQKVPGGEANPLMAALIDGAGPTYFVVLKCAITNVGLVVLCMHKNFRFVRPVIAALLGVYIGLFMYHIYLAAVVA